MRFGLTTARLVLGGAVLGALVGLAAGAMPASATGNTWYTAVGGSGTSCTSGSPCTLTEALSKATNGDTVDLAAGTYQPASATSFTIATSITLQPTTAGSTVILKGNGASVVVVNSSVTATISGVTIEDGASSTYGGGIYNSGTLTVESSTISGNSAVVSQAGAGGGIYNNLGTLTVEDSTISGNSVYRLGGGISTSGPLTVENSTISGNSADDSQEAAGGGISAGGNLTLTVENSTISDNTATDSEGSYADGDGGGMFLGTGTGSATIESSTISGNTAGDQAGGIQTIASTLTVDDSTISDNNIAPNSYDGLSDGDGGGIADASSVTTVEDSTISDNTAASGAGIESNSTTSTLTLAADIIARSSGNNCDLFPGTVTDAGHNVDDDGTCGLSAATSVSDSTAIDDYLGSLGSYGGTTETVPLLSFPSPITALPDPALAVVPSTFDLPVAVSGTSLACSVPDQRGTVRDSPCDIGAFSLNSLYSAPVAAGNGNCADTANACTLPTALSSATNGEAVYLAAGTYQPASATSFTIATSITLQPTTAGSTVILKGNGASVVVVNSSVTATISGVTIEDGATSNLGGGIDNSGTLTVEDSTISGNTSTGAGAGGIDNGGTLTVEDSTISGNAAADGGGIVNGGRLTVQSSTISGNTAQQVGGIDNGGTLTVEDSTISGNTATGGFAGGIFNFSAASVEDSTISGNTAHTVGGGIYNDGTLTLAADIIAKQSAGGDCYKNAGTITDGGYNIDDDGSCGFNGTGSVSDSTVIDDYLGPLGPNGGPTQTVPLLSTPSPATASPDPAFGSVPSTFDLPASVNGGSLACSVPDQRGTVRGTPCDIGAFNATVYYAAPGATGGGNCDAPADACTLPTALSSVASGDIIYLVPGIYQPASGTSFTISTSVTIQPAVPGSSVTFEGNGTAVLVAEHVVTLPGATGSVAEPSVIATISGVTIDEGGSLGSGSYAGGVVNVVGTLILEDSTVSDNNGGGIFNEGTLIVKDSTISDNAAGSGIENYNGSTAVVEDSTISGNSSNEYGSGVYNDGTMTVEDSTISGNGSGNLFNEGTLTLAANIIADQSSGGDCSLSFYGTIIDAGYNIADDGSCDFNDASSISDSTVIDDYLGTLGSYGGPTETVPLLASPSPATASADPAFAVIPSTFDLPVAVNGVTLACSVPDQRGITRSAPCDIGAFEGTLASDPYSYAGGGGTGTAPSAGSGLDGTTITLAANTFSYPGYTFAGWNDGTATYGASASYLLSSDGAPITFTAQWTANASDPYSFAAAGGTPTPASGSGLDGTTISLPAAPTRAGYTFAGWNDGTATYGAGASYLLSSDGAPITFTAQWTRQCQRPLQLRRGGRDTHPGP